MTSPQNHLRPSSGNKETYNYPSEKTSLLQAINSRKMGCFLVDIREMTMKNNGGKASFISRMIVFYTLSVF